MGDESFGARWWRESLTLGRLPGRALGGIGLVGGSALALGGCWDLPRTTRMEEAPLAQRAEDVDKSVDALALQRAQGWNVGASAQLMFPGSTVEDVAGEEGWRLGMEPLAHELQPPPPLVPYYVPTLFQSLIGGAGQNLRAVMRPIHTDDMEQDFHRGLALREQLAYAGWPRDVAIVVDAPGPRAVAVAAALADHFTPVFTFGNWPHPLGVVPAHQTLAATLYYLPAFHAAKALRQNDAPPIFVLDANRLAPYGDADQQFDNRYFVTLPSKEALAALGIAHVLYVSADGTRELDDLNDQLVALQQGGVDVRMVALGDFVRVDDGTAVAAGEPPAGDDQVGDDEAGDDDEPVPDERYAVVGVALPWLAWWGPHHGHGWLHCWYHGRRWDNDAFWRDYPIGTPHPRGRGAVVVAAPAGQRSGAVVVAAPTEQRGAPSPAPSWTPSPRQTIFNNARNGIASAPQVGRAAGAVSQVAHAPAGFGQVPVRASRFDGHITGVRPGRSGSFAAFAFHGGGGTAGRSGSIGRAGGGGGG